MFISKEEISLRAIEPADAALLYQWENDLSIWNVSERLLPISNFEIEQFILNSQDIYAGKQIRFMIDFDKNGKKVTIGTSDIYEFDAQHLRAGIGIYISPGYQSKGFGKSAVRLTEKYCFEVLGLYQVFCRISENNLSSIRLFESLQYKQTGRHTGWLKVEGQFIDQFQYQLNKLDFNLRENHES